MKVSLTQAQFLKSAGSTNDFPADDGAEIAFCGRSNSGKSSAINALCGKKDLARTSKTPGRTQLINFFKLDGDLRLVDLPGYGYAKAPVKAQQQWQRLVKAYLIQRQALCGLILLMDIRHPLTKIDWSMIRWSESYHLPMYVLLTKVDKISRSNMVKTLTKVASDLENQGFNFGIQPFSATKQVGNVQAQEKISTWLANALIKDS